ncbi:ABC transporter substrate-binding protein [Pseudodesulfovibrio sp. zrk46]|uniref:ABC transporter substrate-binding protein n=1 Tax=Pseudodesulfovibrio sp. zrk46 TaxID=2725288 RepID=UPI001B3685AF|nr:ABC transporter substrate-binding protein [Pseudodesulfovibrio sp. zrk46]
MRVLTCFCLSLIVVAGLLANALAAEEPVAIYVDTDISSSPESSTAIARGIKVALEQNGNQLAGRPVEVVMLDHRGNSARSLRNLKKYLQDPNALVLYSGMHSPPLLAHRKFIHENGILLLVPWAAAGPISRSGNDTNWIFRLSVDDSKAGEFIVKRAVDERGFKRPALVLENTGWGQSNLRTMTSSLVARDLMPTRVEMFKWGLRETGAKILLREVKDSGADVIFLVANAPEGKVICKAMHDLPPALRLPIVSHWGITGGDFPAFINSTMRKQLDLEFIQTSFSFLEMGDNPFPKEVFETATTLFPEVKTPIDLTAPSGFIHAYDLTRILIAAVEQSAPLGDDMLENREKVRNALENLKTPVQGLIKLYDPPFRPYTMYDPDAHEALGADDFAIGRYGDNDEIIIAH